MATLTQSPTARDASVGLRLACGPRPPALVRARPRGERLRMFIPKNELQLAELSDDDLVRYVARAKKANELAHATTATFMLLYRHESRMRRRVQAQLPAFLAHLSDAVEDYVLERVWDSALKLPLEGQSVGEWVNWWKTAIGRQVISFWRSRQGQALERETEWPSEREDDTGKRRPDPIGREMDVDSVLDSVEYAAVIDRVLETRNDRDRQIISAAVFEDRASKDVGKDFDETPVNVDKIKSRFRIDLRAELGRRGLDR